jgi:hypothetical protein
VSFPIPMVSYAWNPSADLKVNIGLPLAVFWRPCDDWSVNLSYVPLLNINAKLNYDIQPGLTAYGGYEYLNESYFLADRDDSRDRFFVFEQRLIGGVKWAAFEKVTLDANAGWSFGRSYGQGNSQFGSLRDRVDVAPGPFLGLAARLRF